MALSASYDFTMDRDSIITRALQIIGATASGQTPSADEISDASDMLNLMLKAWQADGLQLWKIETISLTPVQGQYIYTFGPSGDIDTGASGPRPEQVTEVVRRETATTTDVALNRVSRRNFLGLSDKDSEGVPTQFYFNPQDGGAGTRLAELWIWSVPSADFASDYTLRINYQKPFDDMDASTNNLSFPQYWELAIVFGLASLLAVEYGLPMTDQNNITMKAELLHAKALSWDVDMDGSVFFRPEPYTGFGWGRDQ